MKRRVVKKWISRYIKPLVKDIPHENHQRGRKIKSLINGEQVDEGGIYKINYNPKSAIKKQIAGIVDFRKEHKGQQLYVILPPEPIIALNQIWHRSPEYHRVNPKMKFGGIVMYFDVGGII